MVVEPVAVRIRVASVTRIDQAVVAGIEPDLQFPRVRQPVVIGVQRIRGAGFKHDGGRARQDCRNHLHRCHGGQRGIIRSVGPSDGQVVASPAFLHQALEVILLPRSQMDDRAGLLRIGGPLVGSGVSRNGSDPAPRELALAAAQPQFGRVVGSDVKAEISRHRGG